MRIFYEYFLILYLNNYTNANECNICYKILNEKIVNMILVRNKFYKISMLNTVVLLLTVEKSR